jgi:hypothetical protein
MRFVQVARMQGRADDTLLDRLALETSSDNSFPTETRKSIPKCPFSVNAAVVRCNKKPDRSGRKPGFSQLGGLIRRMGRVVTCGQTVGIF